MDTLVAYHDAFTRNLELIGIESPGISFFSTYLEEPKRHYHNIEHIAYMGIIHNKLFKQIKGMTRREAVLVDLAIWWHDIIYDPTRKDNEKASADFFRFYGKSELLASINPVKYPEDKLNLQEVYDVEATILSTTHAKIPYIRKAWSLYMLDLDLAGIGDTYEVFENNTKNIIKEYMAYGIGAKKVYEGRINFWKEFKKRGPIYHNPYNLDYFKLAEAQASKNIDKELYLLENALAHFND